jgi:hypothetical protein
MVQWEGMVKFTRRLFGPLLFASISLVTLVFLFSCGSYRNIGLNKILSNRVDLYSYEPNDSSSSASLYDVGIEVSQEHAIFPAGDVDWISFTAQAGSYYVVETYSTAGYGLNGQDDVDTYIYLYDTDASTVLLEDDDGGSGKGFSKISFQPAADGVYFIRIVDYNTAHGYTYEETGAYVIRFTSNEGLPLYPDGLWHATNHRFHDADGISWYYGQEGIWNYDTVGSPNSGSLTTGQFAAEAGMSLGFWYWLDTEYPVGMVHDSYDLAYVQVSTDGGLTWNTELDLMDTVNDPAENIWMYESVDLTPYTGMNIIIRFFFDTIDPGANIYEGWYVDQIRLD